MEAEIFLSRTAYRAGTPAVGSVRISLPDSAVTKDEIRSKIASARFYLTGQAHLRPGSSSWRSNKEIAKLKSLYGEHACLTFASTRERMSGGDDSELTLIEQADKIALHLRMHNQNEFRSKLPLDDTYDEDDVICFWMTNILDLIGVAEIDTVESLRFSQSFADKKNNKQKSNRYEVPTIPLMLPDYDTLHQIVLNTREDVNCTIDGQNTSIESYDDGDSSENASNCSSSDVNALDTDNRDSSLWDQIMASAGEQSDSIKQQHQHDQQAPLHQSQIAITFRSNLPEDLPPTLSAECVKYFYSAVLVLTTTKGEVIITDCPFSVLSRDMPNAFSRPQSNHTSQTRVHIGELYAMAHSSSLPFTLSPIEALGDRQLHVISDPPACRFLSRVTAERLTSTHKIQDESGALCAYITLVGVGGPLVAGTRVNVVVSFPDFYEGKEIEEAGIVPCHRVCCALVGEEYALCEGVAVPTSSSSSLSKKRKTKTYVFDSTYELVEFGYTNCISMGLLLPLDCPVSIKTDLVEVTVSLKLEFTVDRMAVSEVDVLKEGSKSEPLESSPGLSAIRLDLPIEVVHDDEVLGEEEEEDSQAVQSQLAAIQSFWIDNNATSSSGNEFDDTGIHDDLKQLSLKLLA